MTQIIPLQISSWIHSQTNMGTGGLISQVTKCEYRENGALVCIFYVRENTTAKPSFLVSSGERWGEKLKGSVSPTRQSLELLCESKYFDVLKFEISQIDPRPVLKNKHFTKVFLKRLRWRQHPFHQKSDDH